MYKAASERSSFMIHNSYHNIHLNMAKLLSTALVPEKAVHTNAVAAL